MIPQKSPKCKENLILLQAFPKDYKVLAFFRFFLYNDMVDIMYERQG